MTDITKIILSDKSNISYLELCKRTNRIFKGSGIKKLLIKLTFHCRQELAKYTPSDILNALREDRILTAFISNENNRPTIYNKANETYKFDSNKDTQFLNYLYKATWTETDPTKWKSNEPLENRQIKKEQIFSAKDREEAVHIANKVFLLCSFDLFKFNPITETFEQLDYWCYSDNVNDLKMTDEELQQNKEIINNE